MQLTLALLGIASLVMGALIFYGTKGAVHEIAALILFLISTNCLIAACILREFNEVKNALNSMSIK